MSTPHDYYEFGPHDHRDPKLHNRGEWAPYAEPDWFANHHDGALPVLSTIGRGKTGKGITAEDHDGNLVIKDDETGEVLAQYAIGNYRISIVPNPTANIQEGQNSYFDVIIDKGIGKTSERIIVPCGEQGSRTFCISRATAWKDNMTYQFDVDKLVSFTEENTPTTHFPTPRVGDLAIFVAIKNSKPVICYAPIEHVDQQHAVVVVETTYSFDGLVNYTALTDKPKINGVELTGNKTLEDLGILNSYSLFPDKPTLNNVTIDGDKTTEDYHISYNDLEDLPEIPSSSIVVDTPFDVTSFISSFPDYEFECRCIKLSGDDPNGLYALLISGYGHDHNYGMYLSQRPIVEISQSQGSTLVPKWVMPYMSSFVEYQSTLTTASFNGKMRFPVRIYGKDLTLIPEFRSNDVEDIGTLSNIAEFVFNGIVLVGAIQE